MTQTVGIIGVGHVGAAVAAALTLRGSVGKLWLVDRQDAKAQAEALDLMDQNALLDKHTAIEAFSYDSDWHQLAECDIVVLAAGDISLLGGEHPDRFAELRNSVHVAQDVAPRLRASGFAGVLLNITNPCDVVVTYLQRLTGWAPNRIFGTGTTLDTARMQKAVATALGCNMADVTGYVLGEHGESQFTAWSTVRVAGQPIQALATAQGLSLPDFKEQARMGAWQILAGKGFTAYGIGLSATVMIEAMLADSHRALAVSAYDPALKCYIGQVARLGATGIMSVVSLPLTAEEGVQRERSAASIQHMLATIPV
ncbi:lactate/malate family dehydrogenase [Lacticaseibacillus absianus]|uniref:lactate/malate family dehydrogenase n=1 Tax=Lacticaseibacillus absianus TaxID=2729623 RepID=UPI0015CB0E2C|nr:L-lactate dehydrogenase [Lacticaseibacillus absianus]